MGGHHVDIRIQLNKLFHALRLQNSAHNNNSIWCSLVCKLLSFRTLFAFKI